MRKKRGGMRKKRGGMSNESEGVGRYEKREIQGVQRSENGEEKYHLVFVLCQEPVTF